MKPSFSLKRASALLGIFFGVLFAPPLLVYAGQRPSMATQGVIDDWGNYFRNRVVAQSTSTVVLISSAPINAGLGLTDWTVRVFENTGNTSMTLYGDNSTFTIYQSSAGIHISSDTTSVRNRYTFYGQGSVYAIWSSTGTLSGGVSVNEFYWKAP